MRLIVPSPAETAKQKLEDEGRPEAEVFLFGKS